MALFFLDIIGFLGDAGNLYHEDHSFLVKATGTERIAVYPVNIFKRVTIFPHLLRLI